MPKKVGAAGREDEMQEIIELISAALAHLEPYIKPEILILLILLVLTWWIGQLHRQLGRVSRAVIAELRSRPCVEFSSDQAYAYLADAIQSASSIRNTRIPGADVAQVESPSRASKRFRASLRKFIRAGGNFREIVGTAFTA